MDTMAKWSDTNFTAPAPYSDLVPRTWGEALSDWGANLGSAPKAAFDPVQRAGFGEIFGASERQSRLVANSAWSRARLEDVYDETIEQVKKATGVSLDNPLRSWAGWNAGDTTLESLPSKGRSPLEAEMDAFTNRLDELKRSYPEALASLDPHQNMRELGDTAARMAEEAAAQQAAREDINPVLAGIARFTGGLWGGRKDPVNWASLLIGGGAGGVGRTALQRITLEGAAQGATNAGLTAITEPSIQEGRAAAGLPHGASEAWDDIKMSALFGAIPGLGIGAARELAPAVKRLWSGNGKAEDFKAVREAGGFIPADTEHAYRGAQAAEAANGDLLRAVPETVPEHAAPVQLAEGYRAVVDPDAPLPLIDLPVPRGVTDKEARDIVAAAGSMDEAMAGLRASHLEFEAAVDAEVARSAGAVSAKTAALDGEIADLRQQLSQAVVGQRDAAARQPQSDVPAQIAALETRLEKLRPGSAKARELEQRLAGLREPVEALDQADAAVGELRRKLVERQSDRARLGPEVASARRAAEQKVMRRKTSGLSSALGADDPALRDLGRVATLDPSLAAHVASGEVHPTHAAIVAATTHDPDLQASAVAALREARPSTAAEARTVVSDHVSAANAASEAEAFAHASDAVSANRRPARGSTGRKSSDIKDLVPMADVEGRLVAMDHAAIAEDVAGLRDLADIVNACKF